MVFRSQENGWDGPEEVVDVEREIRIDFKKYQLC